MTATDQFFKPSYFVSSTYAIIFFMFPPVTEKP